MIKEEKYVKIISSQAEKPKNAENAGVKINNQNITITKNGIYTADEGYTGIGIATVNVQNTEPVIQSINITPTTSQQTISASGGVDGYSPITVDAVTSSIDANITANNIKAGVSILGVDGSIIELDGETVIITPSTSEQTITPTAPHNSIIEATVNAVTSSIDANIVAGNIKDGVTILGITGNYQGGTTPAYYIEKTKDANGKAQQSSYLMDLSTFTDVDNYVFAYAYGGNTNISGVIDFSSLTTLSGNQACYSMFYGCTGITGVDLSSLTTISGNNACQGMFSGCTGLTSVDFSGLTTISGGYGCSNMFANCTGLTRLDFPALTSTSFGSYTNQFSGLVLGITGCTLHFPSNLTSTIAGLTGYPNFGGTNTVLLFDLPATE